MSSPLFGLLQQKKKRSVKKTKDTAEGEPRKSLDEGAGNEPAVDDGDNITPAIVEGQLNPEIRDAIKSPSPPAPDKVVTEMKGTEATEGVEEKNVDKRHAKEASPSAAALLMQEILGPVASLPPETDEPYCPPVAVEAGDMNALQELDERKIIELREAFNLFDLDHDGCIDAGDLKATFQTLGVEVSDNFVSSMLSDAMEPLNFESFVLMYGMRTIEMDPEVVLLEALGKWDKERTGQISIER